ncbi:Uma2 family endonuclease [Streptomyces xiamenensis]
MTALPDWMQPPRAEGWFAEDLDHLPEAPRHTELIDGALVFRMFPQRSWHGRLVTALTVALEQQAPEGFEVEREMTVRLDARNRPEPDIVVAAASYEKDRTWFAADQVRLAVEVVSPESAHRDRAVKRRKYAEAGIPHFWRIEDEEPGPAVNVLQLDVTTGTYVPAGIFREKLTRPVPFPIDLDLLRLVRRPGT